MIISIILYLYIFSLSFTGAFVINPWFPLHVILLTTAVVLSLPKMLAGKRFPWKMYHVGDVFLYGCLVAIFLSSMFNMNDKTINYSVAYFYVFGVGYFVLKYLLYENGSVSSYFDINTVAVLVVSVYAVIEVAAKYFTHIDVQSFIPRIRDATATYNTIIAMPRAYAFCTEPTVLAYYLNTLGPLALWRLLQYRSVPQTFKWVFILFLVSAWILTFSPAGIVFMIASIFFVMCFRFRERSLTDKKTKNEKVLNHDERDRHRQSFPDTFLRRSILQKSRMAWARPAILLFIAFFSIWCILNLDLIRDATDPLLHKILLIGDSAEDRVNRWSYALENIFTDPVFGKGVGYLSSSGNGSSISWYLFLTLEAGFIASVSFVIFLFLSFWRIIKSKNRIKYWFLLGFLSAAMHFCVISTIQHPFLLVQIALFDLVHAKHRDGICS